jgi:hypothetical protein
MSNVKMTYVICHTILCLVLIPGGAVLTYMGGSPWWFFGAFLIASADGYAVDKRMDLWTGSIS